MTDLEKLRKVIENSGLRFNYIAKNLNLSRETLYHKLDGKTEFKVSEVNKLTKILNMDNDTRNSIFFGDL